MITPAQVKPPDAPTAGTFEDYVTRIAAERGKTPPMLSPLDIRQAKAQFEAAGRAPASTQRQTLTPNAEANITRQYVKQWTEAGKPARDLDRQVALIDAGMTAAERGDVAQGAQTVLVAFQKILDPTSVVREAEFDRSAAAQSMYQRVRGAAERLAVGGAGVPVAELRKFHTLAKEAAAAQKSAYLSAVKERIGRNADRYNIPRELVFEALPEEAVSDVPRDTPPATETPAQKAAALLKKYGG